MLSPLGRGWAWEDGDRSRLATYPAVYRGVCFAFDGGDKVRGEKVDKCSELGREVPARRPYDPKGSGAICVVIEHGDE